LIIRIIRKVIKVIRIREAFNLIKRIIISKYKNNILNNSKIEQVHDQNYKK
jgi:hypothetical protein